VISAQASAGGRADRHVAIERAGLRGALAVPAIFLGETLAVLEFLSVEPIEPAERLTRALNGIGHEIGHFLSHRLGELAAPVLTPRGLELLQLAARGHTTAEIARRLYLSPATVKRHFERAYAALGVGDRTAAVAEAMRRGLIT
jgi:DNA-binding CsgD family transcriptional regulator